MKKYLLLVTFVLVYAVSHSQVFSLKSIPASKVIVRKEGGSLVNIDIRIQCLWQ